MSVERKCAWITLTSTAAWTLLAVGGVFTIMCTIFAVYMATTIETINSNMVIMSKDSQYVQLRLMKLEAITDRVTERVTRLEIQRTPLIGETPHAEK